MNGPQKNGPDRFCNFTLPGSADSVPDVVDEWRRDELLKWTTPEDAPPHSGYTNN